MCSPGQYQRSNIFFFSFLFHRGNVTSLGNVTKANVTSLGGSSLVLCPLLPLTSLSEERRPVHQTAPCSHLPPPENLRCCAVISCRSLPCSQLERESSQMGHSFRVLQQLHRKGTLSLRVPQTWVQVPALSVTSCVIVSMSLTA